MTRRTTRDPYKTLGVKKTATPDEIKRARRNKARKVHPDKGGKTTEMAEINHAADFLLDPQKRLLYDQTGQESAQSPDAQSLSVLMEAFMDALIKDAPRVLDHARGVLTERLNNCTKAKRSAEDAHRKMTVKRGKISVKSGENLFHALIDQQLAQAQGAIINAETNIAIITTALEMLDHYKSSEEAAATMRGVLTIGGMMGGAWSGR